jgi:hypothetical protein
MPNKGINFWAKLWKRLEIHASTCYSSRSKTVFTENEPGFSVTGLRFGSGKWSLNRCRAVPSAADRTRRKMTGKRWGEFSFFGVGESNLRVGESNPRVRESVCHRKAFLCYLCKMIYWYTDFNLFL